MRAGFGLVDITPAPGLYMAGNRPWPRGQGVQWPLRGRVLLLDDGARRIAIIGLDLMALPAEHVAELRTRLAGPGGLDPGAILVACTHTHRAPFTYLAHAPDEGAVFAYLDRLYELLVEAIARAAAALQPADLVVGRVAAPGWAFNRRPIYSGGEVGTHGPAGGEGFVGMEDIADDELGVLLARTPAGGVLGGLVTFACHPTCMEEAPEYSADYAGVLAEELEARYGGIFCFLLGAAGDSAPPDPYKIAADPYHGLGRAHAAAMGRALAERADAALRAGPAVSLDHLAVATTRLHIAQRQPSEEQVALARWYLEEAPDDVDERAFTRRMYGHDYTFYDAQLAAKASNEYHARELLGMWEWRRRTGARALVEEVEIQIVMIGDVAVVAYPVELFTAFGRHLKKVSPFPDTFVATLANGWHGYVPTSEAFARGGYEPRLAYQSRLVSDAGDLMTEAALALLRGIASEQAAKSA